ncbi:hypothetical protein SLEP1_g17937 [Rubroshorea leprosula]|uniref:Uncharacterized protein n=1 Tax=Rubroshorea leprosula TaxID=152421 RepID=A0AAV5IZH5_9ROSI|nr:hypothetical protein SLEP1_g17937 [Rubroshorea leprosula]
MASVMVGAAPVVTLSLNRVSSSSSSSSSFSRISFSNSESLGTPLAISTSPLPVSTAPSASTLYVYCGRGDRKTAKGKRFNHSFGNARPRDKKKGRGPPRVPMPPSTVKKDRFDDIDDDDDDKAENETDD